MDKSLPRLTVERLRTAAAAFAEAESSYLEPTMYGVTDGKAVGTYIEQKFTQFLLATHAFQFGNSAKGIDLPELNVDIKTTSIRQPQSSCPFRTARQKVFGLGYSLLVFVYEKSDDDATRTGRLDIRHVLFVESHRTGDFQLTSELRKILDNQGNRDDIVACLQDKNLPIDDLGARQLADEILATRPEQGYLTISNALQWRLQYGRVLGEAGNVEGVLRIR